jgi:hypothetical protein
LGWTGQVLSVSRRVSLRIGCLSGARPGEDGEDSAASLGGAPRDRRIGVEHKDVTAVEQIFCSGAGQVKCAFEHVGGELCPDVWVTNIAGSTGSGWLRVYFLAGVHLA